MPAKVILRVISGFLEGNEFRFVEHDTFLFGRDESCHARLGDDPRVSRHHFLLETNPPVVRLRDLCSRNGTYVNGKKYGGRRAGESAESSAGRDGAEVELEDGDEIKAGRTVIRIQIVPPLTCRGCGEEAPEEYGGGEPPKDAYLCPACQACPATEEFGLDTSKNDQIPALFSEIEPEIPGYDLVRELGRGAMGVVYMASRKSDGLPVAIKVARPRMALDGNAERRFQREIDLARSLRHHHIARLLECGVSNGTRYFVMEHCNGGSLDQLIQQRGGRVPFKAAAPLMLHCLEGLDYAHQHGVVHRDLKPQNILLHQYEDKWIAKIADFSLAKCLEHAGHASLTTSGSGGGTILYMPREQLTDFKHVTPAGDIWSIAATFYHLLTGHVPRDTGRCVDPLLVILSVDAIPIRRRERTVPPSVAAVIDKALQTRIADRYATVSEMKSALRAAFSQTPRKR
jgi:eukaryotic-like serine/threonine-protein kinase